MITLDQTTKLLIDLQGKIGRDLVKFVEVRIAADLLARVKVRVQNYGMNAMGSPFSHYSTRPTFLILNDYALNKKAFPVLVSKQKKSLNKSKKSMSKEAFEARRSSGFTAKSVQVPGGYAEIRRAGGYQTAHKDFTVTGNMWKMTKVISVTLSGTKVIFTYGTTTTDSSEKMEGHSKREGIDLLLPSKKELESESALIVDWFNDYLQGVFDK